MPRASYIQSYSVLTMFIASYHYNPHFKDEEIETEPINLSKLMQVVISYIHNLDLMDLAKM
jgi:hypothetical protein